MKEVTIYTTRFCFFCVRAKRLLKKKSILFKEIDVSSDKTLRMKMQELSGGWTVPQIFIGGEPIGGCNELHALERAGELDLRLG